LQFALCLFDAQCSALLIQPTNLSLSLLPFLFNTTTTTTASVHQNTFSTVCVHLSILLLSICLFTNLSISIIPFSRITHYLRLDEAMSRAPERETETQRERDGESLLPPPPPPPRLHSMLCCLESLHCGATRPAPLGAGASVEYACACCPCARAYY
jgi:hypothetical protein